MYLFLADIVIPLSCLLFYFFFVLLSAFLVYIQTETISQNAAYLQRFVKGISICKKDERANNGGCTEPHISHVLAARLSSRPLAWSETTLKHLAPILAAGKLTLNRKSTDNEQPVSLRKALLALAAAFLRETEGLPNPNAIGALQTNGKVTLPLIHYWHSQKNFPTKT